ncbi:Alpha-ketoglutarate-dependent dioxygenase alkB-like protein [Hapsidospora chrysogenum ATCC 11550]|uniref:Alpha-ketoglutarate-dependent dioxygenase alkB-like protein n=1 Tax=Hapsidospora chrysogenum (strain ATCC 11550 / CBS 779.69 / DSM 880 / IAM 14645 / JCM 23072 / IMI 49137) TaxID=857340 RepID=A0A086T572_HAPC1|nr:Alpha-ketoglutarate-dependent dioxygenase alkB-like protein [Hapsidospora chrysogenum ATCC 11550]
MSKKRTLDAFFGAVPKKPRTEGCEPSNHSDPVPAPPKSYHQNYPFPIAELPESLDRELSSLPARPGREINDQPDLDLLYFQPYIPAYLASRLFKFLRSELPFYRVEYDIKRGGVDTHIRTPRWTTVFGVDDTSRFDQDGNVVDSKLGVKISDTRYDRYPPRPIPKCLDDLRRSTEAATGCKFNFCLVNYYASGADSIAFHSDDERFLGLDPAIASFSLGARRDFFLKHKPAPSQHCHGTEDTAAVASSKPLKLPLGSGDMVLMRGKTQSNWLHAVPKRTGKNQEDGGRINITFRRAMIKDGSENYYNYNVGKGPVYRWDHDKHEMSLWKS